MVVGKKKGGESERFIARFLTKWLTGQDKTLYFWRSPGSGSVAKINLGNKAISGDLVAIKPEASFFTDIFNVEVKDGYDKTDIIQLLKSNKNFNLKKFWIQCVVDSYSNGKLPLLLWKQKGGLWTSSLDDKGLELTGVSKKLPFISIKWDSEDELPVLHMFNKKDFFDVLKPEDIREKVTKSIF